MRACGIRPQVKPEISRFPRKELPHMPGSKTTPGRTGARTNAPAHIAFRENEHVGTRDYQAFAALWLAYALPYRRFAVTLADANARLGANADCYSFIAVDLHHLLFAGFYRRTIILLLGKVFAKTIAVYPVARLYQSPHKEGMYSALLMSSGLTFGAIASLYGLSHGIIDKGQYSVLVGAVIASGIVPTMIAGNHFVPRHLVSDAKPAESQKGE